MVKKQKSEHLYLDIFSTKNSKIILWSFVLMYVFLYIIYPYKENISTSSKIIDFFAEYSGSIALWSVIAMYIIAIRPYGGSLFKTIWFYISNILDATAKVKKKISEDKKENMTKRDKLMHNLPIIVLNAGLVFYFFNSIFALIFEPNKYTIVFESSFSITTFIICFLYTVEMLKRHRHYPFEAYKLNKQVKKEAKEAKKQKRKHIK